MSLWVNTAEFKKFALTWLAVQKRNLNNIEFWPQKKKKKTIENHLAKILDKTGGQGKMLDPFGNRAKLKLLTSFLPSPFPHEPSCFPGCLYEGWAGHGPGGDPLLGVIWTGGVGSPAKQFPNVVKARTPHLLWAAPQTSLCRAAVQLPFLLQPVTL